MELFVPKSHCLLPGHHNNMIYYHERKFDSKDYCCVSVCQEENPRYKGNEYNKYYGSHKIGIAKIRINIRLLFNKQYIHSGTAHSYMNTTNYK